MSDPLQIFQQSGQAYAAFIADCWRTGLGAARPHAGAAPWPGFESLQSVFTEHYRRLLAPVVPPETVAAAALPALATAAARVQRAAQALAALADAAAADASRRLVAELSRTDASAAPVTTLRELHDLWVECGEEAWAAAVHQDAYADAQCEWLASLVELQFEQRRIRQAPGGAPP